MKWNDAKKTLLKNEGLRKAYGKIDLAYDIGNRVAEARAARGLTQTQLADLLDTQQPSIARLERGSYVPSLTYLQRIAEVLDTQLLPPKFEFLEPDTSYSHNFVVVWETLPRITNPSHNGETMPRNRAADNAWSNTQEKSICI